MEISEMEGNVCLFCTSPCSPTFTIVDGEIIRLKSEHQHPWTSISFLVDEENPPLLGEQLAAILILKNILGIKEEMLCEFLGKLEGHFHPQFWLQVCSSCKETVSEYYRAMKDLLKLEKKLKVISDELKSQIRETAHVTMDSDNGDGVAAQVWSEVRAEVLKEIENTDQETHAEISSAGPVLNQGCPSYIPINITRYKCPQCPATYHESGKLKKHSKLHSPRSESTTCEICGWVLSPAMRSYSHHLAFHHKEVTKITPPEHPPPTKTISANADEVCKQYFENKKMKQAHVRRQPKRSATDSGNLAKPSGPQYLPFRVGTLIHYKCQKCPAIFKTPDKMKKHLHFHSPGAKATICVFCGRVVANVAYTKHLTLYHKTGSETNPAPTPSTSKKVSATKKNLIIKSKNSIEEGMLTSRESFDEDEDNNVEMPTPSEKIANDSGEDACNSIQCDSTPSSSTSAKVNEVLKSAAEEKMIPSQSQIAVDDLKQEIFISCDIFSEDE